MVTPRWCVCLPCCMVEKQFVGLIALVLFLPLFFSSAAYSVDAHGKTTAGLASGVGEAVVSNGAASKIPASDEHAGTDIDATRAAAAEGSLDELRKVLCEHEIPQLVCDKCRFELGAVKISATQSHLIKLEEMTNAPMATTLSMTGEIAFDENLVRVVTPRFCGRLASMSARTGDRIRKGAVVAQLESLELAEAALNLLKRRSERDFSEKKLVRERLLWEKKIGAEQELQAAQAAYDLTVLEERNATDRLRLFGVSDVDITGLSAGNRSPMLRGAFTVFAPIDGVVIKREGTIGEVVPEERALLTIADSGHLRVTGQAHEKDLESVLKAFQSGPVAAEIRCDAFPGRIFAGCVISIDAAMSPETRTLPVRIEIQNHENLLRPGQFVTAALFLESQKNMASLPVSAVVEDAGKNFVFVQVEPELYLRRDVIPGRRVGDRITIQSGLKAGESVVTEGSFLLKSDVLRGKMGAGCSD